MKYNTFLYLVNLFLTLKENFQINELCWVKIKGYPWWPGIVSTYKIYNWRLIN